MTGGVERKKKACSDRVRFSDESGFIFIGGGGGSGKGCLFWILISIGFSLLLTVGVNLILLAF